MQLEHILAAADDSEEGRAAIRQAGALARDTGARLTVLTVSEPIEAAPAGARRFDGLRELTRSVLGGLPDRPAAVDHAVLSGLPGIEIGRFAEENAADLIVLGRKRRTQTQRLMLGDTTDSVARRSPVPCLLVPGPDIGKRILVALDGTERGLAVLSAAATYAQQVGGTLRAVTVEPEYTNEVGVTPLPTGRSVRLVDAIRDLRRENRLPAVKWERAGEGGLIIRRGAAVDQILEEAGQSSADVLAIGYHRGGPAGVVEAGSVARRLIHQANCAVLTIPL